jgi:hypothetical protein
VNFRIFFQPEKYDFVTYKKGFLSIKIMALQFARFLQQVPRSQNFLFYFLLPFYSQIWRSSPTSKIRGKNPFNSPKKFYLG